MKTKSLSPRGILFCGIVRCMKKITLAVAGLALIVLVALFVVNTKPTEEVPTQGTSNSATTTFAWRFEEAQTMNPDGMPQTNLYLTIEHSNKKIEQRVDTVDGSCSELEGEKYEGDVSNTGNIQCYAAGLGQRYRITKNEHTYSAERKLFEEAIPNVAAPVYEWEVVKAFVF